MITDAAGLLAAAALKTETIAVRGSELLIRELSLAGRDAFVTAVRDNPTAAAVCVILHGVVCPDTKAPLLTQEQAAGLADASADFVQDLTKAILKLSGLGDDAKNE
jgi:hypothetical protein